MPSGPDDLVRLEVGDVGITVDLSAGARAISWTVAGEELLAHHADDPVEHGMYPMAPWAGRIRDNTVAWAGASHLLPVTYTPWALHGTALAQRAVVREHESAPGQARLAARIDGHSGWPWPMSVDIEWSLAPRQLTTAITVHALAEPFPVVTGWHPWFRRTVAGSTAEWSLPATGMLERGDDHLPTGRLLDVAPVVGPLDGPFDDAFLVPDGRATVRWPGVAELAIASDHGWFVVFDELPDAVCVEPQSGPPDGLRVGPGGAPGIASPGRPHVLRTTWTLGGLSG